MVIIHTSDDILRVLRERPEWKAEVRREILTEELMNLPARFDRFAATTEQFMADTERFIEEQRQINTDTQEFIASSASSTMNNAGFNQLSSASSTTVWRVSWGEPTGGFPGLRTTSRICGANTPGTPPLPKPLI